MWKYCDLFGEEKGDLLGEEIKDIERQRAVRAKKEPLLIPFARLVDRRTVQGAAAWSEEHEEANRLLNQYYVENLLTTPKSRIRQI